FPDSACAHQGGPPGRSQRRMRTLPAVMAAPAREAPPTAPMEETVSALAAIRRPSASEGERAAAEWVADRLRQAGLEPEIDAERTVVLMAHHDAPHSGLVFAQDVQRLLDEHTDIVQKTDTSVPVFFPVVAGPMLVASGALLRRPRLTAVGTVLALGSAAAFAD